LKLPLFRKNNHLNDFFKLTQKLHKQHWSLI
jgi:hypothetical protein